MKPGYRTTEFWTMLLGDAFAAVSLIHPGFKPPADITGLASVAAMLGNGLYIICRSWLKTYSKTDITTAKSLPETISQSISAQPLTPSP